MKFSLKVPDRLRHSLNTSKPTVTKTQAHSPGKSPHEKNVSGYYNYHMASDKVTVKGGAVGARNPLSMGSGGSWLLH